MAQRTPEGSWRLGGLLLAVAVGLGSTAQAVFSPAVLAIYAHSPDSVSITRWAEQATGEDAARWWTGPWIQADSPYYRPLSSYLFWLEYRAFGWSFQGHVVISWLLHGAVCGLVYWLGLTLLGGGPKTRAALALLSVILLNLRMGPQGPGWLPAPVAYGVVAWWPAQTDQTSLVFSLLALLLLDVWLQRGHRRYLALAVLCWVMALLFKEMAVCVPLVAGCMILYRKGLGAFALWSTEGAGETARRRLSPGLCWTLVLPELLVVAGYLALRSVLVPGAWGPRPRGIAYFASKALWYVAERPRALVLAKGPWLLVAGIFVVLCVYLYARLPRRPSAVWFVLALVIGTGLIAQVVGGNFALITVLGPVAALGTVALFIMGLVVLLHVRSGSTWPLLGMVAAVHLPVLHVQGPHYWYWPAAFWGLFHASLVGYVWERLRRGDLQWKRR